MSCFYRPWQRFSSSLSYKPSCIERPWWNLPAGFQPATPTLSAYPHKRGLPPLWLLIHLQIHYVWRNSYWSIFKLLYWMYNKDILLHVSYQEIQLVDHKMYLNYLAICAIVNDKSLFACFFWWLSQQHKIFLN